MKYQKMGRNLEAIEIKPNQTTLESYYVFLQVYHWLSLSIVVRDILLERNGEMDEDTKKSSTTYLASRALSLASWERDRIH